MPGLPLLMQYPTSYTTTGNKGDLINLHIQAGEQETTPTASSPKLSSDGLRATIKVTLPTGMPTSGFHHTGRSSRQAKHHPHPYRLHCPPTLQGG